MSRQFLLLTSFFCFALINAGGPKPFGFGENATGGGSATPQTPKSLSELKQWLEDSIPRVILIDRTFDFTNTEGDRTEQGCAPWPACTNGCHVQHSRNQWDWCKQHSRPQQAVPVTFQVAAINPLNIASDKTIKGVGNKGVIKGKGFLIFRTSNIIIQNIQIVGLNPDLVWAGDGLMINGGKDIWVDHCTFSNIGRQMIVVDHESGMGVTFSNNRFDGATKWSSTCLNKHYWTVLLTGARDTITMANNCFDQTSGRSPKVGGSGTPNVHLHYYNNFHTDCNGLAVEVSEGGTMLAEGNLFKEVYALDPDQVKTVVGGQAYVPTTQEEEKLCQSTLGRPCVMNDVSNSKGDGPYGPYQFGKGLNLLKNFQGLDHVLSANIRPTSELGNGPPGGCGIGRLI